MHLGIQKNLGERQPKQGTKYNERLEFFFSSPRPFELIFRPPFFFFKVKGCKKCTKLSTQPFQTHFVSEKKVGGWNGEKKETAQIGTRYYVQGVPGASVASRIMHTSSLSLKREREKERRDLIDLPSRYKRIMFTEFSLTSLLLNIDEEV